MDSSSCIVAFVILLKKRVSVVTPEVKIQGRKQSTPGLFLMAWNFTPEYPGDKFLQSKIHLRGEWPLSPRFCADLKALCSAVSG